MRGGFTLMETITAVFIVVILLTVSSRVLSGFFKTSSFNNVVQNVASLMEKARDETLSGKDGIVHGIRLATTTATFFTGSFIQGGASNTVYAVPDIYEISDISLNGGGSEVVFELVTGKARHYGSFSIRNRSEPSVSKNIIIHETGAIDVQ